MSQTKDKCGLKYFVQWKGLSGLTLAHITHAQYIFVGENMVTWNTLDAITFCDLGKYFEFIGLI